MTLRERLSIIGQAFRRSKEAPVVKEVKEKQKAFLGGLLQWGPSKLSDEKRISAKLLEANKGWVYRNNDVIAKEVATIEFELFSVKLVAGDIVYDPIMQHPILDALDRFNEFTDASSGFYTTQSHKKLTGDAFWYIDGAGPNVKGIYPLTPTKVELKLGDVAKGQRIIESYEYKDTVDGEPIKETYKADEVIHFKAPNPRHSYRGLGVVEAAAHEIDLDNMAIEANRKLFERGMIANFILTSENKLTDAQLQQLHAEFRATYGGVENAFKVPILGSGLKPNQVQISNRDAQMLEMQEWIRDKIASMFGNNKAVLGVTDDVNRANAEATILNWKQTTVRQEMKAICDTLNEFFVPRFGVNLILGFKDPVPEDDFAKAEQLKILREAKIITPNEAREVIGYEPVGEENADLLSQPMPDITPNKPAEGEEVPKSLLYVNRKMVLRRAKVYGQQDTFKEIKKLARPLAEQIVKSRHKNGEPPIETREHESFTNEQVWAFHNKQIQVVEAHEDVFQDKVASFIAGMIDRALANLPEEFAKLQKQLLDPDKEVVAATLDFTPILNEVAIISGQQALKFIGEDEVYMARDIRGAIEANVRKFARSMVETDQEKLTDILAQGVANGDSVAKIRKTIETTFEEFTKVQAERITRTEVIKTSNMAAIDAWEQTGLVEAKQWLTAEDDRVDAMLCAPMNGKIISLKDKFFKKGEEFNGHTFGYESIKQPPLHPNCRCTLLPVLVGQKSFEPVPINERELLTKKIADLESKVDKRTKAFKELKAKSLDDKAYIGALEKHLGVSDES